MIWNSSLLSSSIRYIIFFFLFITICPIPKNSLNSEEIPKYTGPIPFSEKRIFEGKQEFLKTGNFPLEWKLYFKTKEGDYAVFYDLNGDEIHFRYRRNKFDRDGDLFVKDLIPGNPYFVKGDWTGYYYYSRDERGKLSPLAIPKKNPPVKEEFSERQTIPIFKLTEYFEIRTDELLF